MLPENLIYAVLVLQVLGASTYMIDTLRGRAKPNRVSWLLWGSFTMIAFFASLDSGAGIEALYTLLIGVNRFIIFGLSFINSEAYWKATTRDYKLGALAVVGIILWAVTGEGLLALGFAIFANFMAGLPTMAKAYRQPETESGTLFGICIITSTLTLLTVQGNYTLAIVGFPLYISLFCIVMFYLIVVRPRLRHHGNRLANRLTPS